MGKEITSFRDKVKKQILEIRDSGFTNMFDKNAVQGLANEWDLFDLVCFIEDNPDSYANFILTGDDQYLPD